MEEWRDIKQTGGQYQVSSKGRVRRLWRNTKSGRFYQTKMIKISSIYSGYLQAQIYINRRCDAIFIHRLVAGAFIPNPNNYPEINHIDCDKTNNTVENLEWCDRKHNMQEAAKNGRLIGGQIARMKHPHFILQMSMNNEPIRSFWSAHEADSITNINFSAIRGAIRQGKDSTFRGGYKWKECSFEEFNKYKDGPICKVIKYNNGRKKISAISDDGRVIKTYESVMEAARKIRVTPGYIRTQMRKKQRCKGYYWAYTDSI